VADLATDTAVTGLTRAAVAAADWSAVAASFADLGFEQSASYAEAAARRIGGRVQYCVLSEAGRQVAAAAVRIKMVPGLRRGIAWIAAGPLVCPTDAPAPETNRLSAILAALRAEFCERQGHLLRFRLSATSFLTPETVAEAACAAGFARTGRAPVYRSSVLSLDSDAAELMAGLHGKWRTDLRFAQKSDLRVEHSGGDVLASRFMALYDPVQKAKGFDPEIPPGFHFPLADKDYRVETLIAIRGGVDLAGIVTGTCGSTTTYLFGATGDAGRPLRAGYLLQWEAMARARVAGCRWYDLGGLDPVANPDVARFKDRMGGLPVLSEPWEARSGGLVERLLPALETLRARLKRRR
jgi:lipid II:glycine glycyltransferase (peptidoglycan interpeptide bridge formation enzyme)